MNPVKLKFRHGGEMLVSPIGLRFVEDPEHGPLVLIPEVQGPRGYQLDMTVEEAEQAFRSDQTQVDALAKKVYWLQEQLKKAEKGWTAHEERLNRIEKALHQHYDRWRGLAIHLGLPEGWEHLNEGAAEVKGALVSQAEMLDSVKAHVDALYSELGLNSRWEGEKLVSYRDTDSILTEVVLMQREVSRLTEESSLFTVAEKVGELEEARRLQREATAILERRLRDEKDRVDSVSRRVSEALEWINEEKIFRLGAPGLGQRQTGPIEITWTHAGPRNAATGQPIDCSSWRAPEKPKSAWKPLIECNQYGAFMMKRRTGQGGGIVLHASRNFEGWTFVTSQNARGDAWKPNQYPEHYEFCPIPE